MALHIPDTHVQHAWDVLKDGRHARAKAAYEFAEKHLKVVLANLGRQSNLKTQGERAEAALVHPEYAKALRDFELIAGEYNAARDQREAANAILDGWRTLRADERGASSVR